VEIGKILVDLLLVVPLQKSQEVGQSLGAVFLVFELLKSVI